MGKRKTLHMEIDAFFAAATLLFGAPNPKVLDYESGNRFARGPQAWSIWTEEGRRWAKFVLDCGEAKGRAGRLYRWYCRWYKLDEPGRAALVCKLKEGLPKAGKQAMHGEG